MFINKAVVILYNYFTRFTKQRYTSDPWYQQYTPENSGFNRRFSYQSSFSVREQ